MCEVGGFRLVRWEEEMKESEYCDVFVGCIYRGW